MGADGTGTARMGQERSLAPHSVGGLQAPVSVTLAASRAVNDTHVVVSLEYALHPGATSLSMLALLESGAVGVWYEDCPGSKSQANLSTHAGGAAA